jgi:hypothetical protein
MGTITMASVHLDCLLSDHEMHLKAARDYYLIKENVMLTPSRVLDS